MCGRLDESIDDRVATRLTLHDEPEVGLRVGVAWVLPAFVLEDAADRFGGIAAVSPRGEAREQLVGRCGVEVGGLRRGGFRVAQDVE